MKRKLLLILIAIVIIISGIFISKLLMSKKELPKKVQSTLEKRYVKADNLEFGKFITTINGSGRVEAKNSVTVYAETSGLLESGDLLLREGNEFADGSLLFKIDNTEAIYSLKSRKSSFLKSLGNTVSMIKSSYPEKFKSWQLYFDNFDLERDLAQLPDLSDTKFKVFLATTGILNEYYGIKSDEYKLKKYSHNVDFNGTIKKVYLKEGSYVNSGSKIADIISSRNFEVTIPVKSSDVRWIDDNATVIVYAENRKWNGKVIRKANSVDQTTQSINTVVEFECNKDNRIFEGEYVSCSFSTKDVESFKIPRKAIVDNNKAYKVNDGKLALISVEILRQDNDFAYVLGIEDSDLIVIESLPDAYEGMKIEIIK
ncbi:MAG: HlyD family efflux transporter periplasmic adaptor subunit [Candidatus Delongbacteria bacterium]|nr:HlyD family efflux transporter periplasmic adaptor subunit [Candidatus Delongbacteria bacterium]MBN2835590.1 HlyD family efflux transporter periplasmic adaptor subunit [Candidatus Delongbacteria bacterium]